MPPKSALLGFSLRLIPTPTSINEGTDPRDRKHSYG